MNLRTSPLTTWNVVPQDYRLRIPGPTAVPERVRLALAQPDRRVLVLDGDGSLLMNLGCLATIAVHRPANLALIVFDNGTYETTGGQATHTARGVSLEAIARDYGAAHAEYLRILGVPARSSAAPGWTANARSLEVQEERSLLHTSDTRGGSPFATGG